MRQRPVLSSLRARLSVLILLAVIPAVGLMTYIDRAERRILTDQVKERALGLARFAAGEQQRVVVETRTLLQILAELPEVRGGAGAGCGAFFVGILQQYRQFANLGFIAADGNLECSGLPFTPPVNVGDRPYFTRAMEWRSFAAGEYQIGRVTGQPTINYGYPVFSASGRVVGVVFAAVDVGSLGLLMVGVPLEEGSTLTVVDRNGVILARHPEQERWVGRAIPETPLFEIMRQEREGATAARGVDGVMRLYGFTEIPSGPGTSGIFVAVGVPIAEAFREANRLLTANLLGLGIAALLAVIAIWIGGRRLVIDPVGALTAASLRLRAGDLDARTGLTSGPTEVRQLGATFDEMAAALQERQAERDMAEAQILEQLQTLTALYNAAQKFPQSLDVQALAGDIARACVTFGAQLAWLVQAEPDGTVRLLHSFPVDVAYPKQITVRWDETPEGQGVVGRSIRTGFPVVVEDVRTDPGFVPWREAALAHGFACAAGLPLTTRDRPFGALILNSTQPGFFTPKRVEFFQAYANLAAAALENARLFEETEQHLHRLQALRTIDTAITGSLDLRVTLDVLLDQVTAQLNVAATDILLLNPYTQVLEYAAGRGFRSTAVRHRPLRIGEGYAGRVALERKTLNIARLKDAGDFLRQEIPDAERFVSYVATPLVAKGETKGVLEVFSQSPLDPTPQWLDFLETLAGQAAIAIDNAALFGDLQRANVDLTLAYETTLEGWSRALELRDRETEGHTQRVTELTVRLARAMDVPDEQILHIRRGALLHDIGKMGVPDAILNKPGQLSEEEWTVMRRHPVHAYELLSPIAYLRPALDIPYAHHEKWDGTGYPRGLKGEQIPLAARLFAVADVWDELRSNRPYRPAWTEADALTYIREQAGRHFDPAVVAAFLRTVEDTVADGTAGRTAST